MRLSEHQRRIIREAGLRHFGVVPLVFGSRVDDARRGGDIDLYIDKPMDAALAYLATDDWLATRLLLNQLTHDYPEDPVRQADVLNRLPMMQRLIEDLMARIEAQRGQIWRRQSPVF